MQLPRPLRGALEQELSSFSGAQLRAAAARLSECYRHPENGPHLRKSEGGPHPPAFGECGAPKDQAMSKAIDCAAYLAVRMPATFAAIEAALSWTREVLSEENSAQVRSMLDLGTGPGTALWAAAHVFPTLTTATALERDPQLIEIGRRLAAHSESAAVREAHWLRADLTAELPAGSWDLVVCAYALNELAECDRARLIREAWARCSKLLVMVEPGTRTGFANVLAVREQMLSLDWGADVPALIAPCPHSLACPMAGAGDWCHFAARVERTSGHRHLKEAELGHEDEKFSYVAFGRGLRRHEAASPAARIVRHPRIFSGYAQLTLCTEGRLEQTTVTRSRKEDWRRLKRLGWGDEW